MSNDLKPSEATYCELRQQIQRIAAANRQLEEQNRQASTINRQLEVENRVMAATDRDILSTGNRPTVLIGMKPRPEGK